MTQVEELEGLENKVENRDLISTGYEKLKIKKNTGKTLQQR